MADDAHPRVTFLITALGVGGAEVQLVRLATALHARGWPVLVLALRSVEGVEGALHGAGIPTRSLTPAGERLGLRTASALLESLRTERPACLVTFLLQANVLGRVAGAWCRVPVVSSIRNERFGGDGRAGPWLGDALERLTAPLARAVVFNSHTSAAQVAARRVVPARKVRIIGNALPPEAPPMTAETRANFRADLGLDAASFAWLNVGSLHAQKNQLALVEALARHRDTHPTARLLIAGAGPLEAAVRERVTALGLTGSVTLLGLRRDVPALLQAVDGFVLSSRWEGLPNVVMEALAAGTPTLATPVGGVDELVEDGVSGWLARSPDAADLCDALDRVVGTAAHDRAAVAATGRSRVLARFGADSVTQQWVDVVEDALGARRERGRV